MRRDIVTASNSTATPRTAMRLGDLSVDQFMRRHWQRRALLIRGALPGIEPPLSAAQLIALSERDDVESRLISNFGGRWRLRHGPFEADELPALTRKRWTLLVQGVDLHDDRAHALLERFRFIPDARLDDLMISLASDGGGVGAHLDSYDVFLLQVWGRRRWRWGRPGSTALLPDMPVKLLAQFEPEYSATLEPGDMLYLPPGWAHDGVAEGPCMTCSIGFRAPSRQEFLAAFLADMADAPGGPDPRFTDRGRAPTRQPSRIPADLARRLAGWAADWRAAPRHIEQFIGRYLSEPRPQVWFETPRPIGLAAFLRRAARDGLRLDRRTRLLQHHSQWFVNGETVAASAGTAKTLRALADARHLPGPAVAALAQQPECSGLLHRWWLQGWLR